jgi:hypothetical protein
MFLHLVDALSIAFVVYGDRGVSDARRKGSGSRFPSWPLARDDDPAELLDEFLKRRVEPMPTVRWTGNSEGGSGPWSPRQDLPP